MYTISNRDTPLNVRSLPSSVWDSHLASPQVKIEAPLSCRPRLNQFSVLGYYYYSPLHNRMQLAIVKKLFVDVSDSVRFQIK